MKPLRENARALLAGAACVLTAGSTVAAPQSPFAPPTIIDTTGDVIGQAIIGTGAVNDDGLDDLILILEEPDTIGYKLNLGNGQFAPAVSILSSFASFSATGDMNGDGLVDLVFINPDSQLDVNVLLNLGNGSFGAPTILASADPVSVGSFLQGLALEDLDLDGQLDVIAYQGYGFLPFRALGQGDGTTSSFAQFTSSFPALGELHFGDIDGDLVKDVVLSHTSFISWGKGLGAGLFAPRTNIASLNPLPHAGTATLLDVDSDGLKDIVFDEVPEGGVEGDRELRWIRSEGAGSFASPATLVPNVRRAWRSAAMDFDLDGDDDLLHITATIPPAIEFVENLDGIGLAPPVLLASSGTVGTLPRLSDNDGDGDIDLIVASYSASFPSDPDYQIELFDNGTFDFIGSSYCGNFVPNSTGSVGTISAYGSTRVELNRIDLVASNLPASAFGVFITSQTQGFPSGMPGTPGALCLAGSIGRYSRPGEIQQSNAAGTFGLALDLLDTPQPQGAVAVQPGETWNFQAWHRDQIPNGPSSNLTAPVSVTF